MLPRFGAAGRKTLVRGTSGVKPIALDRPRDGKLGVGWVDERSRDEWE